MAEGLGPPTMVDVVAQLEQAEVFKNEGNALFKEGNYKKALGKYWKVFCYVNGLQIPGESNQSMDLANVVKAKNVQGSQVPADKVDSVKRLKQSTYLNMAACYLKTQDHHKCVDACTKALAADGPISKAYFRRGQAHLELRNLDEAKEDFEQARKLEPGDQAVEAQLRRLKQAFAQHDAKEKKKYARMFSKMEDQSTERGAAEDPIAGASDSAQAAQASAADAEEAVKDA